MTFDRKQYLTDLFSGDFSFEELSQRLWAYQFQANHVMRDFATKLNWPTPISMPIEFFKHTRFICGEFEPQAVFESSGTTGQQTSRHYVKDLGIYEENVLMGFAHAFPQKSYRILALLPSYLERNNSSLVQMVKIWMDHFGLPGSGFYLYNFEELQQAIMEASNEGEPILLIGVAFALLDFVESYPTQLPEGAIVIETGGMKGRKKEIIRSDLHQILKEGFQIDQIRSEYGMTEMLSQAYTREDGRFQPAPTLRVWTSDIHLQKLPVPMGKSGRLHLIDLANVDSCGFIATDDLGRVYEDGSFEVLGRIDTAELRGCNLMYV
jgi:hypothetical protein